MKSNPLCKSLFVAAFAVLLPSVLSAAPTVKVDAGKPKFDDLPSPQINGGKSKPFNPKDWLEVESEIKVQLADNKKKTCDQLTVKWFVAVNNPEKSGTYLMFTRDIEYVNIPVDQKVFISVYLSPSSILRITGQDRAGKNAVLAVGYEILAGGEVVATDSSKGGKWWSDPKFSSKLVASQDVPLLTKPETPFASMWWDRYAEVKPAGVAR